MVTALMSVCMCVSSCHSNLVTDTLSVCSTSLLGRWIGNHCCHHHQHHHHHNHFSHILCICSFLSFLIANKSTFVGSFTSLSSSLSSSLSISSLCKAHQHGTSYLPAWTNHTQHTSFKHVFIHLLSLCVFLPSNVEAEMSTTLVKLVISENKLIIFQEFTDT